MILGIDISTSITGVAIVDPTNNELIYYGHIDLRKTKCVFEKGELVKKEIQELLKVHLITMVAVEQPFMFFNSGGSSAKTMATLQRFNGIVSWISYNVCGLTPIYITVAQARKLCGIKVPRGHKAKAVVLEHLLSTESTFKIEYTRHGNPKAGSYDQADAIIIAKAGTLL
jgi:Holliday junction resolvasome RuvABC endonuclease subunit